MRILFLSRASLFTNRGGDTTQMIKTAAALKELGIEVDIHTADQTIDYQPYDLIHFFNIIRPADILFHVEQSKLPFVVSTIYVDYSALKHEGWKQVLYDTVGKFRIEYLKSVARYFLNGEKIRWIPYWWKGQKAAIQQVLNQASCLLPNSQSEFDRLKKDFPTANKYEVVANGVELELFNEDKCASIKREHNKILCVARIESIKNQLKLIEALNNTEFDLYLIGKPSTNQQQYYQACKKIAADNIHFIEGLTQEELLPHYASAKVHILPSWFETTGLSSLEAAAMGCVIVVTDKGDTKDYFKEDAYYCDPSDSKDIYRVIQEASKASASEPLLKRIHTEYNWKNTAIVTAKVYKSIINKS